MINNYILTHKLKVPRLSFGCMSLDQSDSNNDILIKSAIDQGINLFDTADLYDNGKNECLLGAAVKQCRSEVIISSKVGNKRRSDGNGWDWCPRKEYIIPAVEASLSRLQTDYLDICLLHGGTIEDPIDEVIEAFEMLVEQGKIRSYGLSSIRPEVIREYVKRSNITTVMLQYSLLDRRAEEEILPLLLENNIGVFARGTLAGGLLADKVATHYLNKTADEVGKILSELKTAIQFVSKNKAITSAVVGIRTQGQLQQAIKNSQAPSLTNDELDYLVRTATAGNYEQYR